MRKFLLFSLTMLMLLSFVGVVGASEAGKLLIWADDTRSKALQEIKASFEDEYGIPVEIQELPFGDIRGNLSIHGPSGEGPDIIVGAHDWLGELVANGLITPVDLAGLEDQFYDVTLEAFTTDGKLYALPYGFESIALIYNKDLVAEPPTTFAEFYQVLKELRDPDNDMYGAVMPQPDPYHTFPFLSATGGYIFAIDENGNYDPTDVGLNNDGAVRGLTYVDQLYAEELIPNVDYQTMMSLFTSGKAGMLISGPWTFTDIKKAGINYGVTKIPTIKGQTPKPFVGVQGFMISAFSENKMLAQAFLTEYVATKSTMMNLYELADRPPAYIPAGEIVKENPDIAGILASAADGMPMPSIPEMGSVWQAWTDALEVVLTQKQDPKPALDNAVDQIHKAIQAQ